jgi:hypothetical protein
VEQTQHLIAQHPHRRSLGNVVTTGQPPGDRSATRTLALMRLRRLPPFVIAFDLFVTDDAKEKLNILRFGWRRCGYLSAYRRAAAALLLSASLHNIVVSYLLICRTNAATLSNSAIRNVSIAVNTTAPEHQQ